VEISKKSINEEGGILRGGLEKNPKTINESPRLLER
jgi:hypothetical protein